MKCVLITGANSYIGTSFQAAMARSQPDWRVEAISLRGEDWKARSFSGWDTVLHTVGIAHVDRGRIGEERKVLYYQVNTRLALEAARKAKTEGVGQFIYLSSALVYGDSAPPGREKNITAQTPVSPAGCYGDSKLQAELELRELESPDFSVVILRLPMVYGRGSKGNYPLLSRAALVLPAFPWVENHRSMLYIENLCELLRLMILGRETGTFWPQNEEYVCTSELVAAIAQVHGHRLRLVGGLGPLLRLAGRCTAVVNKVFGDLTYDQALSRYQQSYQVCSFQESIRRTEQK